MKGIQNAERTGLQIACFQNSGGHILGIGHAAKQAFGRRLRFFGGLLAVHHFRQFEGENLFGTVQLFSLPGIHLVNLLQRQEGEHADALHHIGVVYIAPVLVKLKGACFVRVQPHGVASRFAHLFQI